MTANSQLIFIPSPGVGHLPPMVELAKLLLHHDQRLSITIIIMNYPYELPKHTIQYQAQTSDRLRFIDIPSDESTKNLISPNKVLSALIQHHKPRVRDIVCDITESDSVRLVGFVVDMMCTAMLDVAHEFTAPTYLYFASSAATLGLMFYVQLKHDDDEELDVTEWKDSGLELSIPSFANPVPANVLPSILFDKEGGSKLVIDLARSYRETKGIIVNTFEDLEKLHGIRSISVPPLFPLGPILNLNSTRNDNPKAEEILAWLDDQPERSVVFLCFGSMGSFSDEQVKEIAVALERSGERFLWSIRRPPLEKMGYPEDYENPAEVLPEGFLERTSRVGKVIGWAPQTAVLSHPSVGGFVSHCGWNSTLESMWYGVPVAAWPLYAEQQLNAFQLVVELGIATEIRMDYQSPMHGGGGGNDMLVTAEEIESGIRRLMKDGEMREKAKEMQDKCRFAISEGGSSYASIQSFINLVMDYK